MVVNKNILIKKEKNELDVNSEKSPYRECDDSFLQRKKYNTKIQFIQ